MMLLYEVFNSVCRKSISARGRSLRHLPTLRGRDGPAHWARGKACRGYGPKEFVRAFSAATWVVTDSFHAMMFSSIFNCNARFVRPQSEMRKMMFARVEEFSEKCVEGDFLVDDVAQALSSFEHGETVTYDADRIVAMRAESLGWLKNAIMSN